MKLIAHRGASGYAPENTSAAFSIALDMGAKSMELDVRETQDARIVVLHDESLRRTAGYKALIGEMPYAQVAALDAGQWFAGRFSDQHIPLLERVLSLAKGRAELHVEVKGGCAKPGFERRLLDLLKRTGWKKDAILSSFHSEILKKVRELDTDTRLGYLVKEKPQAQPSKAVADAVALRCESVHLSLAQADARWVRAIHDAGMQAYVYTVNGADQVARLEAFGVDGVFTNYPDLLSKHWQAVGGTL